jgi:hypothetical protein
MSWYAMKPHGIAGTGAPSCMRVAPASATGFAVSPGVQQHSLGTNDGIGRPMGQGGVLTG